MLLLSFIILIVDQSIDLLCVERCHLFSSPFFACFSIFFRPHVVLKLCHLFCTICFLSESASFDSLLRYYSELEPLKTRCHAFPRATATASVVHLFLFFFQYFLRVCVRPSAFRGALFIVSLFSPGFVPKRRLQALLIILFSPFFLALHSPSSFSSLSFYYFLSSTFLLFFHSEAYSTKKIEKIGIEIKRGRVFAVTAVTSGRIITHFSFTFFSLSFPTAEACGRSFRTSTLYFFLCR